MTKPKTRAQAEAFAQEFERRAAECDRIRAAAKTERLRLNCERNADAYRSNVQHLRALLSTLPDAP